MSVAATSSAPKLLTSPRCRLVDSFYLHRDGHKLPFLNLSCSTAHGKKTPSFEVLRLESNTRSCKAAQWRIGVFQSGEGIAGNVRKEGFDKLNLDAFLPVIEVLFIAPSTVFLIGCAVSSVFSIWKKSFEVSLVNRLFVWQFFLLVGAVVVGAVIRRRQWDRIWRESAKSGSDSLNLVGRVEKLEEDLRSSVTIIRVLSRQLEKLGIRFRVTRKSLKGPITETAALAQRNSEATRELALQEDILEKELGEIQKVLLAMQEQQQKQLELILAIGKSGRLRESKRDSVAEEQPIELVSSVLEEEERQMETQARKFKGANNDRL